MHLISIKQLKNNPMKKYLYVSILLITISCNKEKPATPQPPVPCADLSSLLILSDQSGVTTNEFKKGENILAEFKLTNSGTQGCIIEYTSPLTDFIILDPKTGTSRALNTCIFYLQVFNNDTLAPMAFIHSGFDWKTCHTEDIDPGTYKIQAKGYYKDLRCNVRKEIFVEKEIKITQ